MKKVLGVFLSDLHIPEEIDLNGTFKYIKDLYYTSLKEKAKLQVIIGGDVLDVNHLYGVDGMRAESYKEGWYEKDCEYFRYFFTTIGKLAPKAKIIYLEGNHEERYTRLTKKYPEIFNNRFNFLRDAVPSNIKSRVVYIPYGTYRSFYKLGDCLFMHGTMYPENHAKRYALTHIPFKVVYGHLHHFQSYTAHSALPTMSPKYAVTGGCLSHLAPEWKKGSPHQWQNGFISFVSVNGVTTPTVHLIEKGRFYVGGKEYQ
jgi:UDP-2,3-diacylglucosamine pyrophosphatase LpxH